MFPDGSGGARLDRGVLRLPHALPGDVVAWREVDRRGSTVVGAVEQVLKPSDDRTPPPCPHQATCGGCDLAGFSAAGRARSLAQIAQRAFGVDAPPRWVDSPRPSGHRARIKLAIDGGRVGYRAEGTHTHVPIDDCGIARDEVRDALRRLRVWLVEHPGANGEVEIRSDGARAIYAFQGLSGVHEAQMAPLGDVALDGRVVAGDPKLALSAAGVPLRASPRAFFQVNLEINALLVAHVRDTVLAWKPERVLDLYAGIGNLGLPIAAAGVPVYAVEREGQATADLRAVRGDLRVDTIDADVERFDPSTVAFDVAVLDPPRAGGPGVVERVVRQRPRGLVYVACDVTSGARDLRAATDAGYRLVDLTCFDMFPHTRHFETVATFVRDERARPRSAPRSGRHSR